MAVAFGSGNKVLFLLPFQIMPRSNNKVADDGTSARPLEEEKAMVGSPDQGEELLH